MRSMMKIAAAAMLGLGVSAAAHAAAPAEFAQCAVCHQVKPGANGIGPSLFGVVGRKSGVAAAYAYSPALKKLNLTWTDANLDKWIAGPMKMAPGTKMTFAGYPDAAKRKAVIAYLKTLR
jgi:cytochrome c